MTQPAADLPAQIHTLHILNKTKEHSRSAQCLALLTAADTLLLTENAVLSALEYADCAPCPAFMLEADARARSLKTKADSGGQAAGTVSRISYPQMVQLGALATRIISW